MQVHLDIRFPSETVTNRDFIEQNGTSKHFSLPSLTLLISPAVSLNGKRSQKYEGLAHNPLVFPYNRKYGKNRFLENLSSNNRP